MKTLQILAAIMLFVAAAMPQTLASEDPLDVQQKLRSKITGMMVQPDLSKVSAPDMYAEIEFIVTRQNQIILTGVSTRSPYLERYIMERLNYRKIDVTGVRYLEPYYLSIRFAAR